MIVGYARVSTQDQNLNLQRDALEKAGCELILEEKFTGKTTDRPKFQQLLAGLRPGDTVVVWKLDRLGRSLSDLIRIVLGEFKANNIGFKSLTDNIDTTTASGQFFFHMLGAMAEYERARLQERTLAGLEAAKARGRKGGRKKGLDDDKIKIAIAAKALHDTGKSYREVATLLNISLSSAYRYIEYADNLNQLQKV